MHLHEPSPRSARPRGRRAAAAAATATLAAGAALGSTALGSSAAAASPGYTMRTIHVDVVVGPTGGPQYHCDVIGDLYRPQSASSAHPVPAILTTNGFGGSKDDQAAQAKAFAADGYGVLSYSGLGFGGSSCNIELDDRDWDGKAASQLVTFLGGGKAATDGTRVNWVRRDATAHDGAHHANDPRVGMIGGSYGGQVQFAAAGIDPRIDTIIPIITWNDLAYSLAPNNTSFTQGVSYSTPGVEKTQWVSFFSGEGLADISMSPPVANDPPTTCPNFDPRVCPALTELHALGYPTQDTIALARHASVVSFANQIKIPTLLAQGEADSLFNLQESVATYESLKAQGTPVKLMWQSWGHSHLTPVPGELDWANPRTSYEGAIFAQWFDHYLKGVAAGPALNFSYFRPWAYNGTDAGAAYASAPAYPAAPADQGGRTPSLAMSAGGQLTTAGTAAGDSQTFTAGPTPTSYSETSAVGDATPAGQPDPYDTTGGFASWTSGPLSTNLDVAGIPSARFKVSSVPMGDATQAIDPLAQLTLFVKLYDYDPTTSKLVLVNRLISPIRVAANGGSVDVQLPGIVHEFPTGHELKLVVAGSEAAYANNRVPQLVTVTSDPTAPGLTLPVTGGQLPR